MKLNLFDNTSGYMPSEKVRFWWRLLPQHAGTYHGTHEGEAGKKIPPVYADPKNVSIHFILVFILIGAELYLMLQLRENGIDFMVLLILSIIDFIIAVLPILLSWLYNTKAEINARIFIAEAQVELNRQLNSATETEDAKTARRTNLKRNLLMWQRKLIPHRLITVFVIGVLLTFSVWKFISFYEVLGSDIFVEPIGRFIVGVILLSIAVHLISTKIVFAATLMYPLLWRESGKQIKYGDHTVDWTMKNVPREVSYPGKFKAAVADNQRIMQAIDRNQLPEDTDFQNTSEYMLLPYEHMQNWYRNNFKDDKGITIIYTGILADPELLTLAGVQNASDQLEVLVTGKEIQLQQI